MDGDPRPNNKAKVGDKVAQRVGAPHAKDPHRGPLTLVSIQIKKLVRVGFSIASVTQLWPMPSSSFRY